MEGVADEDGIIGMDGAGGRGVLIWRKYEYADDRPRQRLGVRGARRLRKDGGGGGRGGGLGSINARGDSWRGLRRRSRRGGLDSKPETGAQRMRIHALRSCSIPRPSVGAPGQGSFIRVLIRPEALGGVRTRRERKPSRAAKARSGVRARRQRNGLEFVTGSVLLYKIQ